MNRQIVAIGAAVLLALVGFFALFRYASTADDRAFEGTEMVTVLKVVTEVPDKTPASDIAGSVTSEKVPKAALVPGALTSLADVDGLVTRGVLVPGDQLTAAKFAAEDKVSGETEVPKGMQQLTIPIDGARFVGGAAKAGDKVGVFSSYEGTTANPINDLLVLTVTVPVAGADAAATTGTLVTVAAKTLDVEKLVHTMEFGKMWMTKQGPDTDTTGGKTITSKDVAP